MAGSVGLAAARPATSVAGGGVLEWRVGDVRIVRLPDLDIARDPPTAVFPWATAEFLASSPWLRPHFLDDAGRMRFSFQGFLVETPRRKILVDTGLGPARPGGPPGMGRLMASLDAAGVAPDAVDLVVHTHLHPDHVGWDARQESGRVEPGFPNARYVLARTEHRYWAEQQADAKARAAFSAAMAPFVAAQRVDLVDPDHELDREVRLWPTPGHTPGHVSVRIVARGRAALITGDALHHPLQLANPTGLNPGDHDPTTAAQSRRRLLDEAARRRALLIGSHFAAPTAGRVLPDGTGFRLEV